MAAVNVTLNGVICDLYGRTITGPVKIVGELMYSDRFPAHPLPPPGEGGGEQPPVHIWGGGNEPFPTPPIVIPKPPEGFPEPPDPPDMVKPPPPGGGWGYSPEYGWGYFPKPGEPGPKA